MPRRAEVIVRVPRLEVVVAAHRAAASPHVPHAPVAAVPNKRDSGLNERVYFEGICRGFPGVFFGASRGSER